VGSIGPGSTRPAACGSGPIERGAEPGPCVLWPGGHQPRDRCKRTSRLPHPEASPAARFGLDVSAAERRFARFADRLDLSVTATAAGIHQVG